MKRQRLIRAIVLLVDIALVIHSKRRKKDDEEFEKMSECIKLKRELNGRATKHEIDL